ncbi:class I SAM-dependent methyltransferase [Candidatus Babeliales bacterium]|nr:class I SAM-dependent methyltransferase [Candidatus Babeliales bacterium]
MKKILHKSANSIHYNKEAQTYDSFNEESSRTINTFLEKLFKKHKIKTILDLTCGTGLQVFWLQKKGFEITGFDISPKMITLAKQKSKKDNLKIKFSKGDMRITQAGKFDAVITIFNSIGHLTKQDFKKTIKNIHKNLETTGLYVFDIFNLEYLLERDNITKLTIDWLKKSNNITSREIQYSTIDSDGVLASYDIYHEQEGNKQPKISHAFQTLQVYNKSQLKELLESNGFKVIKQCNMDGSRFYETKTERIVTIAKKI